MDENKKEFLRKNTRLNNFSAIPNEIYGMHISSTSMIIYAKLLSRAQLSMVNDFFDDDGRAYVIYTLKDLAEEVNRSVTSVKANINELVAVGLVEKKRSNVGRNNMLFVKIPASSIISQNTDYLRSENKPYISRKTNCSTVGKVAANNIIYKQEKIIDYKCEKGDSL
ncbi:MAG: replication initiator protein A [Lachnospiraceae bacterium]|nr:replication initiator protein A [Lachnospiraceae bacterium]